jgi:hypothetical protein
MRTILAVAVGKSSVEKVLDTANPSLTGVRPYIQGLISWLASQANPPTPDDPLPQYVIGTDYRIVYRERLVGDLASAFQDALTLPTSLVLCCSTSVARAANTWALAQAPSMPIVAIVSDPYCENFQAKVCGVSASRDRLIIKCFKEFKKKNSNVKKVFALHRDGYPPSLKAKGWLGKKIFPVPVADGGSIEGAINTIPTAVQKKGLLVLPVDRFFAYGDEIVQWAAARSMPTFWSTPDYPASAFGGFGFPQELCGRFLAERVATIWNNQDIPEPDPMPDPAWVAIDNDLVGVKPLVPLKVKKKKKKKAKAAKK